MMNKRWILIAGLLFPAVLPAQPGPWYTQGDFAPVTRVVYTLENTLDVERTGTPVVITRAQFPIPDIHELWITVVDPLGPPAPAPSAELLNRQGGHELRQETNGHIIFHQLDDLDKDGIWDELFFQVDLKPREKKTVYIYMGENSRGWNPHRTHANIGSYCRHLMPFWESENIGWKIWFANSVDVYAKRKPVLMSQHLYMENLDGYGVSLLDHDFGTDIQSVDNSFGGGAICLFEFADRPEIISNPRFTPKKIESVPDSRFNAGQLSDTRYAYEVVVNGPVRSMVKIKGMNWDTGNGFYEYEQYYTAYAGQSYCTSKVIFNTFLPRQSGVLMGCGVYKKPMENVFVQKGGFLVSAGPERIKDPEMIDDREAWLVPFIGISLIVRDEYRPEYFFNDEYEGNRNHVFRVTPDGDNSYEYMLIAGWSQGAVYNTAESFTAYAEQSALEYNNPVIPHCVGIEQK